MVHDTFISRVPSNAKFKRCFIFALSAGLIFVCYQVLSFRNAAMEFYEQLSDTSHNQEYKGTDLGYLSWDETIDRQRWQQISFYEVLDKHQDRANESCVNVCDENVGIGCNATNIAHWKQIMSSPKFNYMQFLTDFQYIYPFEVDYLSQPALTDDKLLPDLNLSKVYMYGAVGDQVLCGVGDVIKGRVDLVDSYGKNRILGGDDVRVWIVDKATDKFKAMGNATDIRNGSYQISVKCIWPGKTTLNVAVAYPREYLRVVIQHIHHGITRPLAFLFKKGNVEEVTIGLATPNIPGRPCLCNFTSINQQSLYAGRPLDPRLSCEDWIQSLTLAGPEPSHVTPAEYQLIMQMPRAISTKRINHNLVIVANNASSLPKLKSCSETNPRVTWTTNQPNGYWSLDKNWVSLLCERPNMTSQWVTSCLTNTSVWSFGDSNGVRLYNMISAKIFKNDSSHREWPSRLVKTDNSNRINLTFTPLEYPLYMGSKWKPRIPYGGVAKQIDSIPSTGKHIVTIHYYLHTAYYHLSVVVTRLTALHDAIQRLLKRNPNILVGIRGPHVSYVDPRFNHAIGGDNLGIYLLKMIQDIFDDLKDKVVFLDGWDMTLSSENYKYHPNDNIPAEMINTLLAFKCA